MVLEMRLINALVISLHKDAAAMELHADQQQLEREEEGKPMGIQVTITRLGDLSKLWITYE
jgi:hypothetical protein